MSKSDREMALRYGICSEHFLICAEAESDQGMREILVRIAADYETLAALYENRGQAALRGA